MLVKGATGVSLNWVIIGLNNGLLHVWCQAIVLTNDDFSPTTPQGTNFNENNMKTKQFSLKKLHINYHL